MTDDKLKKLEWYIRNDIPIFPCGMNKVPLLPNPHPEGDPLRKTCHGECGQEGHGFYDATLDVEKVREWHARFPNANWSQRTGSKTEGGSGIVVVDLDVHNPNANGYDTWENIKTEPVETVSVRTGGGGLHLYFKYPEGHTIGSKQNALGPGVDVKANGGYVLLPPSETENPYTFELRPGDVEIADLPSWILERLNGKTQVKKKTTANAIPQGMRNDTLFRYACGLRGKGMTDDEVMSAVKIYNLRGAPPLDDKEVETIVESACKYESTAAADTTDVANAIRFRDLFKDRVRYCAALGTWLIWDGKRWRKDDIFEIYSLALEVADMIRNEADAATDQNVRAQLAKGWVLAKDVHNIDSFLKIARAMLPIRPEELDQATALLNVNNGILDMSTGELMPHDPDRHITKLMDVDYSAMDDCPRWRAFLEERVPKEENREYLQRIIGYALSGRSDAKRVPFIFGPPDTGKSTFMETIKTVCGEYVQKTNIELILTSRHSGGEGPTPLLRQLFGARMVIASEIPKGRTINDGVFKDLSGGDSFIARGLHEMPVSGRPTHCLVLYGNYKPDFKDQSGATGNRMAVIGFNVIIPPEKRKDLLDVIGMFLEERTGILNWIVDGYMSYTKYGLREPADIMEARKEYETEQDVIQRYISENCEFHDDYAVKKTEIYKDYVEWCKGANERTETRKSFTREITRKGYEAGGHGRDQFKGLKLRPAGERA